MTEELYLRTSFPNPDREFRDGEVIERFDPDWFHGRIQMKLVVFFANREESTGFRVAPSMRIKLRAGRHVVPDVSVFYPSPSEDVAPEGPPFIVMEVLSEEERVSTVRDKLQEYATSGVTHICLVDPRRKLFYLFQDGLREVAQYELPELGLTITPAEIFG